MVSLMFHKQIRVVCLALSLIQKNLLVENKIFDGL